MSRKRKQQRVPGVPGTPGNVVPLFPDLDAAGLRDLAERLDITPETLPGLLGQAGALGRLPSPEPLTVPSPPDEACTYRIRVDLSGARPAIWRRLELSSDLPLDAVHDVLQVAMGWMDGHLHGFRPAGRHPGAYFLTAHGVEEGETGLAESDVRLDQVLRAVGDRLVYDYDFGDGWEHTLRLEQVRAKDPDDLPARCLGGRRACPPEDVGGVHVYNDIAAALTAEPSAPQLDPELSDWLPPDFDPAEFDADAVDRDVRDLFDVSSAGLVDLTDLADLSDLAVLPPLLARMLGGARPGGRAILGDLIAATGHAAGSDLDQQTQAEMVRPWIVLLEEIGPDGVALTQAGYLPPAVVRTVFDRLGLGSEWVGKGNREDLTVPVAELRTWARQMGLVRRHRGRLLLTNAGRALADDPPGLWRHIAAALPIGSTEIEQQAGMIALLAIAAGRPLDPGLAEDVSAVLGSLGWRSDGQAPTARDGDLLMDPTIAVLERTGALGDGRGPRAVVVPTPGGRAFARAALGV